MKNGAHHQTELWKTLAAATSYSIDDCKEIGLEPSSLRRSLLTFGADAAIVFRSLKDFEEVVERYTEIGITEPIFYYPHTEKLIPTFKEIAAEIIPTL